MFDLTEKLPTNFESTGVLADQPALGTRLLADLNPPRSNYLHSNANYVELLTFKIPTFRKKHEQVNHKGLYWETIEMKVRPFTISVSKKKAKRKRDKESKLIFGAQGIFKTH